MLYLNLVLLTYYCYHHKLPTVVDETQWGTTPWKNTDTDVIVKYPIAFTSNCYISLSTLVQAALDGKSASVQIGTFTNSLTEIHLLYTNTNLVSVIYTLRSYWLSFGK